MVWGVCVSAGMPPKCPPCPHNCPSVYLCHGSPCAPPVCVPVSLRCPQRCFCVPYWCTWILGDVPSGVPCVYVFPVSPGCPLWVFLFPLCVTVGVPHDVPVSLRPPMGVPCASCVSLV